MLVDPVELENLFCQVNANSCKLLAGSLGSIAWITAGLSGG
jgi:hypothetical protein